MNVNFHIGANAYAHIKTDRVSLDILLSPGRSAAQSLIESAEEMRRKAQALLARAELCEQAAQLV